jgi:type I restriction enzyme S subunit
MICDLKPYPAMKDSGVPWLEEVPGHWEVLPNRALFMEVKERNHPEEQMLSVTITKGVIPQQTLLADSSKKDSSNQDKSAYKVVRPGDIAYNKMRAWQGAIGVSDHQGIVSPAYVVQRPRDGVHPRYFHYLLRTPAFAKEAERWSYGITSDMWSLRPEHFKMIYGCLPPFTEQDTIVRFLDYMDRRMRKYIRAKQKLVKLLEEQKQAIIHRAVTRGLDPNVRLKPSGVKWLGDVPEHWEVVPLKRIGWFKSGAGFPVSDQGDQNCEVPFLKVSDMTRTGNEVWIETASSTVSKETASRLGAFVFPEGAIIFPKVGGALLTNKRRLLRKASCIDNNVMGCMITGADLQYAFVLLQQLDIGRLSKPGPVPAIGEGDVREIKVALPRVAEQTVLVQFIHGASANLDAAIDRAAREIALLREYRTRLIADVVTGKLDVREVAARLPDETDEPEPLDETDALSDAEEDKAGDLDAVTDKVHNLLSELSRKRVIYNVGTRGGSQWVPSAGEDGQ